MSRIRRTIAFAVALSAAPALTAEAGAQVAGAPEPDTTIVVRANSSALEFDPAELAVKQGKRVRIRFTNMGTLPHNFVLVKNEDDIDALAAAAMKAAGDYVPPQKEKLWAYTLLASPGQTLETTFVVPPPGEYTYVCFLAGHANTMIGTLRSLK